MADANILLKGNCISLLFHHTFWYTAALQLEIVVSVHINNIFIFNSYISCSLVTSINNNIINIYCDISIIQIFSGTSNILFLVCDINEVHFVFGILISYLTAISAMVQLDLWLSGNQVDIICFTSWLTCYIEPCDGRVLHEHD